MASGPTRMCAVCAAQEDGDPLNTLFQCVACHHLVCRLCDWGQPEVRCEPCVAMKELFLSRAAGGSPLSRVKKPNSRV